jgi:hypothetical protein
MIWSLKNQMVKSLYPALCDEVSCTQHYCDLWTTTACVWPSMGLCLLTECPVCWYLYHDEGLLCWWACWHEKVCLVEARLPWLACSVLPVWGCMVLSPKCVEEKIWRVVYVFYHLVLARDLGRNACCLYGYCWSELFVLILNARSVLYLPDLVLNEWCHWSISRSVVILLNVVCFHSRLTDYLGNRLNWLPPMSRAANQCCGSPPTSQVANWRRGSLPTNRAANRRCGKFYHKLGCQLTLWIEGKKKRVALLSGIHYYVRALHWYTRMNENNVLSCYLCGGGGPIRGRWPIHVTWFRDLVIWGPEAVSSSEELLEGAFALSELS